MIHVTSLLHDMYSRDPDLRLREARGERIVKPGPQTMIPHQALLNKDKFLPGAAAIAVDFKKFVCLSCQKYRESLNRPVCV